MGYINIDEQARVFVQTLFETPYDAGPHDMIGGKLSGLYDEQGNIKRGMSGAEAALYDRWSELAIPIASPFAAAQSLPPQLWNAIGSMPARPPLRLHLNQLASLLPVATHISASCSILLIDLSFLYT